MADTKDTQAGSDEISDELLCQWALTAEEISEEQHLSQKLSHLSASNEAQLILNQPAEVAVSTTSPTSKKRKKINDDVLQTKVPTYLTTTYPAFRELVQAILSTTASSLQIEDVRDIASLLHQLASIEIQQSLWQTYLRSGTGALEKDRLSTVHSRFSVWPSELKSKIKHEKQQPTNADHVDYDTCLDYVYDQLRQLVDSRIVYKGQLDDEKERLKNSFTSTMENTLVQFIEQQELVFTRIEIESKIAIIEYDYQDQLIEYEFNQLQPNSSQLDVFKKMTTLKQDKEQSNYEVAMLKQRLFYCFLPEPLYSLQLPLPSTAFSLNSIHDEKTRQNLLVRYKNILENTKTEMMSLYIAIAESRMYERTYDFNRNISQLKYTLCSTNKDEYLNEKINKLIERRFKNIDERLQHLYNLKMRFLHQKTNKK